ncbi:hypothetical protein MMC12_001085 [Toensbergia leucococca]|nr:hypothetical protein [Toensbergia leucococca]
MGQEDNTLTVEKLAGSINYKEWARHMKVALNISRLWNFIEGTILRPPPLTKDNFYSGNSNKPYPKQQIELNSGGHGSRTHVNVFTSSKTPTSHVHMMKTLAMLHPGINNSGDVQEPKDLKEAMRSPEWMKCISEELALWSIQEYGTRNREVHRDLNDLKRAGEFPLLASILCADRNDLSSTFSLIKSETDITHLRAIIQSEIDTWFEDTSDNPNHPAAWVPSIALHQFHKDAVQKANQPSKDEIQQANIARSQRRSEEKVARQKEASAGTSSLAGKKRIASTEEPRGSERERQESTRQQRFKVLSQNCKLEDDMKRINRELALLDENDSSLDEQGSEDYIP